MRGQPISAVRVKACAKINFGLRVLSRLPDGYHEVRTTLQSIALADTLTFTSARGPFRIECDDPDCPTDERNIVWRAAGAVWEASGRRGEPRHVVVQIRKRIPMQAGLGGGSSDAAAALRGLALLWDVPVEERDLLGIASRLGADVPFFLAGGTALGLGRGDLLFTLADAPPAWVVLALPRVGVSTKEAYAWWDGHPASRRQRRRRHDASGPGAAGPTSLIPASEYTNDFEPLVAARIREVRAFLSVLGASGAWHSGLSGSGSAVFGLFASRPAALACADRLLGAGGRPVVTRTLGRRKYLSVSAAGRWASGRSHPAR